MIISQLLTISRSKNKMMGVYLEMLTKHDSILIKDKNHL